jgi:hypothetical protein
MLLKKSAMRVVQLRVGAFGGWFGPRFSLHPQEVLVLATDA